MLPFTLISQDLIEIANLTLKVGTKDEEVIYYAFEKGDEIVFSFKEVDDKKVKEVEIFEYPSNKKLQKYEVKKVEDKRIKVNKRAIYGFRLFNNHSLKKRVCKVKIGRIPASEDAAEFDTGIDWVEKYDTTYTTKTKNVIVGYDTIDERRSKYILVSADTNVTTITDRVERVHSSTNLSSSNTSYVSFQIPQNIYDPSKLLPYQATEYVSWAYAITVGDSGETWYKNADSKAEATQVANLAVSSGLVSSGYGALAVLAIEGLSLFSTPPNGDNVQYSITNAVNGTNAYVSSGNSVAVSHRIDTHKNGYFSIQLTNDNIIDAINVKVRVLAVSVTKRWKNEYYTVQVRKPIKEKKTEKIPHVTSKRVPVMIEN